MPDAHRAGQQRRPDDLGLSRRRGNDHAASSTCVLWHARQNARRGRSARAPERVRIARDRAHPPSLTARRHGPTSEARQRPAAPRLGRTVEYRQQPRSSSRARREGSHPPAQAERGSSCCHLYLTQAVALRQVTSGRDRGGRRVGQGHPGRVVGRHCASWPGGNCFGPSSAVGCGRLAAFRGMRRGGSWF